MTDLDKLIEAVEAGTFITDLLDVGQEELAYDAFSGSLDAANALHDALLPGRHWIVGMSAKTGEATADIAGMDPIEGTVRMADPARAWLLATLKAYRAQVQK